MYAESGKYLKNSTGMQNDRRVNYIITNKKLPANTIYIFLYLSVTQCHLYKKRMTIHFQTMDVNKSIITMIKRRDTYNCTSTLREPVFIFN